MKKLLSILLFLLIFIQCNLPPPILTATLSMDLPGGAGTSAKQNYTDFTSTLNAGLTTLTFSNQDGEKLEFKINGLHAGANFDIMGLNSMTSIVKITDETGALTILNIEDSGAGFLSVSGLSGSGANITGMAGQFQVNVQVAGGEGGENANPSAIGTIIGNIGFNN